MEDGGELGLELGEDRSVFVVDLVELHDGLEVGFGDVTIAGEEREPEGIPLEALGSAAQPVRHLECDSGKLDDGTRPRSHLAHLFAWQQTVGLQVFLTDEPDVASPADVGEGLVLSLVVVADVFSAGLSALLNGKGEGVALGGPYLSSDMPLNGALAQNSHSRQLKLCGDLLRKGHGYCTTFDFFRWSRSERGLIPEPSSL